MSKISFEQFIINVGLAEAEKMNNCHDNLGQFCSTGGGSGEDSVVEEALSDMYSVKKGLRKKYPAMSSDEITIRSAKQVAKEKKIKYQKILQKLSPNDNIRGGQSWDKDGNIIRVP